MAIRFGMRRSRWTPRRSARSATPRGPARGVARIAATWSGNARRIARGRPRRARPHGPAPGIGDRSGAAAGADGTTAVRSLVFQRPPRFFGYITAPPAPIGILGDFLAAAVNPNVGRLGAFAGGHRDRVADSAMDRRAHRLPGRMRRGARQRRQHGELRLLPGCTRGKSRMGCAGARGRGRFGCSGFACTARSKPTHGFKRLPTLADSVPPRSGGSRRMRSYAWTSPRCAARSKRTCRR